jgi:hypothetical protein
MPIWLFTSPIYVFTMRRSWRSRSTEEQECEFRPIVIARFGHLDRRFRDRDRSFR